MIRRWSCDSDVQCASEAAVCCCHSEGRLRVDFRRTKTRLRQTGSATFCYRGGRWRVAITVTRTMSPIRSSQ